MSSSSTSQTRKSEIANKQKQPGCSTPLKTVNPRLSSISLSAIETNSSSDGARKRKLLITEATLKKKQKRRWKDLKRKSKRNVGKNAAIAAANSDSDWVTELETSDVKQQTAGDTNSDILFKDLRSPEFVRREHHVVEDYLESPIIRPRRNKIESPEKLEADINYEPLSPNDTSHLLLRIVDSDDEEEAQLWKPKDVLKTYSRTKIYKKKAISPKDKSKQWLVDVAIPSTTSNLLWDDYVQKHPEEMRAYVKKVNFRESCNKNNKDDNRNKRPTSRLWPESEVSPNMSVVRGTWNHSLKKFDLVYDDVYNFPGSTDEEFAEDKVVGARISLNEFRRKRRAEKEREQATSSRRVRPQIISSIKLTNLRYERQGQHWKII